ncbi:rho guanine nucleotide exchange factor 26 [Lates japonicus]|uniref:Rho guanine nucleotide exchange factor 26 n=1 Tax=Lates japonicus TaxID=270547 RepID=A0AAD3MG94_LATJO|nr:rho guanine nucleotide exchange factor 26 [Lates japonicus]
MDIGNDVDLSNNNITPLWKRRTDNCKNSQDSSKPKPRPLSYHLNGVMTTDFPVEDNKCSFTLSQPAERLVVASPCSGRKTAVLKHVLHKPSRKSRVVRSISIGHLSNGRFPLSKFRSEDSRSASLDNRVCNGDCDRGKTSNGEAVWPEKRLLDPQKRMSSPFSLSSQKDQIAFGMGSLSPEPVPLNRSSPVLSQRTLNNNNYNHHELSSLSSASSPSPPACHTPTPSHSSTSSIPSLSSLTSSDPPTPRSPSPADRGQALLRQSSSSPPASSQDTRHASSSSSISSTSPSPSLSPSVSPSIVLSTHSPAALKMGTQQLIPKGLASDVRQSKTPPSGQQGQGLAGLLGLDPSKRALKALSMVETGAFFSTGGDHNEGTEGESESPGTFRRGLRSTSYRRAVVSGVDLEVPSVDPKFHRLLQPVMKGLDRDSPALPISPASPGAVSLTSPGTAKPASPGTAKPVSPGTPKPASPGTPKLVSPTTPKLGSPGTPKSASPKISKPSSAGTEKPTSTGKNKSPDKKKVLTTQWTFDSEEEELYQNYQEKALHNDSDEDADSRGSSGDSGIVVQYRPIRTSWSQLSVVKKSGLSDRLSQEERKRQEAIFEVISSEHSYLHSLEILIRMFKNSAELSEAMTKTEHHHLFSNITDVCEASKKFFKEVERHQQSIEESYTVIDYALRDQIWVGSCQPEDVNLSPVRSTTSMLSSRQAGANHLFRLRFRSNHSGEKVPMILGTELLNERARWISALGQNVNNKKSQDRIHANQMEVIRTYTAKQPDELSLQVADVVLVSQTVEDGWCEGERLRDGERGWFLAECAEPITCQATIERNMQRMDRLQGLETNV